MMKISIRQKVANWKRRATKYLIFSMVVMIVSVALLVYGVWQASDVASAFAADKLLADSQEKLDLSWFVTVLIVQSGIPMLLSALCVGLGALYYTVHLHTRVAERIECYCLECGKNKSVEKMLLLQEAEEGTPVRLVCGHIVYLDITGRVKD